MGKKWSKAPFLDSQTARGGHFGKDWFSRSKAVGFTDAYQNGFTIDCESSAHGWCEPTAMGEAVFDDICSVCSRINDVLCRGEETTALSSPILYRIDVVQLTFLSTHELQCTSLVGEA